MSIPRGIRNNNPGNIRHGDKWKGLSAEQKDSDFCTFDTPEYGIRAMGITLMNYQRKHGLQTVEDIINRWAPPVENDTKEYAAHIAAKLGVKPHSIIVVSDVLPELVKAMILHENGKVPYDDATVQRGCDMAMGS